MIGDAVEHFEGVIKELNDHRKVVQTFENKLETDPAKKEEEEAKVEEGEEVEK